ncbi:hypothetical protein ABK040_015665 [Willaertia magna]
MLTKRSDLSAQTIGSLIYLTGGCVSDQPLNSTCQTITSSMEVYNPKTNTFSYGKSMPRPRYRHTTVAIAQRYLFVIGGRDLNDSIITPVDVYDVVTDSWSTHPNAKLSSECCSDSIAFVLRDISSGYENIYLPGGYFANYSASNEVLVLKTLNSSTAGSFEKGIAANTNFKRGDFMSLTHNNKGYVIGGFLETDFCKPIGTTEEYDPSTNKWTVRSGLAHPRADGAAIMIDANLFVLGGETKDAKCNYSVPVADVEKYLISSDRWIEFVSLPTSRFRQTGEIYGDAIYVFGGQIEDLNAKQYTILDWTYSLNFTNVTVVVSPKPSGNAASVLTHNWITLLLFILYFVFTLF